MGCASESKKHRPNHVRALILSKNCFATGVWTSRVFAPRPLPALRDAFQYSRCVPCVFYISLADRRDPLFFRVVPSDNSLLLSFSFSLFFFVSLYTYIYIYISLAPHFCVTKIVSRGSTFTDWLFVLRDPLMNDLASGGNRTTRRQNYMWGRMVAIIGQDVFLRVSSWVKCLKRNCMGRGDRCYVWRIVPLGILRFFLFSFATWRY